MGVIFVAGVHGVGKTTCCRKAAECFSISHFTASELIKDEIAIVIHETEKIVKDVDINQELLIQGVEKKLSTVGPELLLDGHFTLLNSSNEIVEVSIEIFQRLHPDVFVVFYDEPEAIRLRLIERDGLNYQVAYIEAHQDAELAHAHRVSSSLQIPVVCLQAFNSEGFQETIRKTWTTAPVRHSSSSP